MATGGGGMQNLGGAQYTVTANTAQFNQGMQGAQTTAQQTATTIVSAFSGLQIVPRQLAAINQSIMTVSANLAMLSNRAATSTRTFASMGDGFGGLGMQMMMVAQIADDMQYGFRAIVNQLPMAGMALGQAFGMAMPQAQAFGAAVGIIGVIINQVINHWGQLTNALNAVVFDQSMSELEKVRVKAEEAGKAFDELTKKVSKAQAGMASGAAELFAEKGQGAVLTGLTAAMMNDPAARAALTRSEQDQVRYARDIANSNPAEAERVRQEVRDAQNTRTRQKAADLMGEATMPGEAGDRARAQIEFFARRNRAMFPAEMPEDMRLLTKEGQADAEQKRQDMAGNRRERKLEEAAKEKDNKLVDELNKQGRANQEEMMRDQEREKVWDLQDEREKLQEQRAAVLKEPKPFTGDFFDFTKKIQESALEQKKLARLEAIDAEIKKTNEILKQKQREAARAG